MILVTGATGLVGAHLVLTLSQHNQQVRALYRQENTIEKTKQLFIVKHKLDFFDKIQWVQADILDIPALEQAFQGISHVYHCAALVSFEPKDKQALRNTNIQGTANVVNLCIDFKIEKLCYVSSIAALGENTDITLPIDEQTQWNPEIHHSNYAMSKYGGEMEVWRATQEGLKVVIVNPGIIFSNAFISASTFDILAKLNKNMPYYTTGIAAIVFIDDIITSMITLMQSSIYNQRFCIVSDNIAYSQLLPYLAQELKAKKIPNKQASPILCKLAYNMDFIYSKLSNSPRTFTKEIALASQSTNTYNSQKIEQFLSHPLQGYKQYLPLVVEFYLANIKPK